MVGKHISEQRIRRHELKPFRKGAIIKAIKWESPLDKLGNFQKINCIKGKYKLGADTDRLKEI